MFEQQQSLAHTPSSKQEVNTGGDLQNLLEREEIVDLKQYIDTEANAAAEARLSELMKALDENGDGQVSLTEFTEHATEENLSKLVTDGVITEGEKSKISQDRRHHQVIGSKGDSRYDPQSEEAVATDTSIAPDPAPQVKASMDDILAAMGVATGPQENTQQEGLATTEELSPDMNEALSLNPEPEHITESLEIQKDLEALRAIRDELNQRDEDLETETNHNQIEIVEAEIEPLKVVENELITAEHVQNLSTEVAPESVNISEALSQSLERLETVSAEINADLHNNNPVPFEEIENDLATVLAHETEELLHAPEISEPLSTEVERTTHSELSTLEDTNIPLEGEHATPEAEQLDTEASTSAEPTHAESLEQDESIEQDNAVEREHRRFKGRQGDFILSV